MYNCSVSGDTSEDLRKRIRTELEARDEESKENVTLISIGGNDSLIDLEEGERKVGKESFEENLEFILETAGEHSSQIIFISGTPNNWSETNPLEWDETKAYRKEDMEEYAEIKKELCRARGVPYIDLHAELGDGWEEKLFDGVHPDSEGHREIKEVMKSELKELGVIPESV